MLKTRFYIILIDETKKHVSLLDKQQRFMMVAFFQVITVHRVGSVAIANQCRLSLLLARALHSTRAIIE